jgi:hypothetical protein
MREVNSLKENENTVGWRRRGWPWGRTYKSTF